MRSTATYLSLPWLAELNNQGTSSNEKEMVFALNGSTGNVQNMSQEEYVRMTTRQIKKETRGGYRVQGVANKDNNNRVLANNCNHQRIGDNKCKGKLQK